MLFSDRDAVLEIPGLHVIILGLLKGLLDRNVVRELIRFQIRLDVVDPFENIVKVLFCVGEEICDLGEVVASFSNRLGFPDPVIGFSDRGEFLFRILFGILHLVRKVLGLVLHIRHFIDRFLEIFLQLLDLRVFGRHLGGIDIRKMVIRFVNQTLDGL